MVAAILFCTLGHVCFIVGSMRALLSLVSIVALVNASFSAGISHVELDNTTYSNISNVYITGNRITIRFPGGGTSGTADKFPQGFLASWGIASNKLVSLNANIADQSAKNLDAAIRAGCFREVHGVVYDIRKRQSGWLVIQNVKVYQIVGDGALVDTSSDPYSTVPILIRNLPDNIGDSDFINAIVIPDGSYSYENKLGDERVIRAYNAGRICDRTEIPEAVLSGIKAFDVNINRESRPSMTRNVVDTLPESEDLMVSGSGFFITEDGYFITNAHVVKNARRVKIQQAGKTLPAVIVRSDETNDLALLKVQGHFKPLPISTNAVNLGQSVFTIGFPDMRLQGTEPKYTDGKISSMNGLKDDPTEYQISVPVQPGNSGGPLVDLAGNVEGVIVARLNDFAALAFGGSLPQNVNYAIKGSVLRDFLSQCPGVSPSAAPGSVTAAIQATQSAAAIVLVY